MKVSALLVLLLAGLLVLSGCTILHTETQTFHEDGTSEVAIDQQLALPQADMDSIRIVVNAMLPTITDTNYRLAERLLQRSNEAYAAAICAGMKNATCTVGADNRIHVVATLGADSGFYTVTVQNDTTNASAPKEIRTYEISKIPTAEYFAVRGKTASEFELGMLKSFTGHFKDTLPGDIDSIITTDYYCLGISPYGCDVVSSSGNTINLRLTGSSGGLMPAAKLVWMGCSARNSSDLSEMNETQAAKAVSRQMMIGKTPNATGLDVSVTCPANETKMLVVATTPVSTYASKMNAVPSPTISIYSLLSKQSIKTALVQTLDRVEQNLSQLPINNTPIGPLVLSEVVIDLQKGTFGNTTTLQDMQDSIQKYQTEAQSANISLDIEISYAASFPGTVISATGGSGTAIPVSGNGIKLTLADLARMGNGKIVVKTEKPLPVQPAANGGKIFGLDPVTLFGGAIVVVIVLTGIVWFLTRKPKEPDHTAPMPPTTFADPHHPKM